MARLSGVTLDIGCMRLRGCSDRLLAYYRRQATSSTGDDHGGTLTFTAPHLIQAVGRNRCAIGERPLESAPTSSGPASPVPPATMRQAAAAVPREQWPWWATRVAAFRVVGETGVGSTVKRLLGGTGEGIKLLLKAAGVQCGCDARRKAWDENYPYECSR